MAETTKANPFVYADNDPISETDPSGSFSVPTACLLGAGGAVVAAVVLIVIASVVSGGLDIPLLLTSLALYGQGSLEVAGAVIDGALLTGCLTGAGTQILADVASSIGLS